MRFSATAADDVTPQAFGSGFALAPDGRLLAFYGSGRGVGLHLRALGALRSRLLPRSSGDQDARFSPDGRWIATYSGDAPRSIGELSRVSVDGGVTETLATVFEWRGMSWAPSDRIVFGSEGKLWTIAPDGSARKAIVVPDSASGDRDPSNPLVLPDAKTVAFALTTRAGRRLALGAIDGGAYRVVDLEIVNPVAYADGIFVYGRGDGTVAAVRLDASTARTHGEPVVVADSVAVDAGGALAAVSANGTAAWQHAPNGVALTVVDLRGGVVMTTPEPRRYLFPAWSPDGSRLAVSIQDDAAMTERGSDVWLFDVRARSLARLTRSGGGRPAWSPDGREIAFIRERADGTSPIYVVSADGGDERQLVDGRFREVSYVDGQRLVARVDRSPSPRARPASRRFAPGIWLIDRSGTRAPVAALPDSAVFHPAPSPDGRWLAYVSLESGRNEVYVRALGDSSGRGLSVSSGSGWEPRWSPDGRRLFYRAGSDARPVFVAATLAAEGNRLAVTSRDTLLADVYNRGSRVHQSYDVRPDGSALVVVTDASRSAWIEIVTNWFSELREKVPR